MRPASHHLFRFATAAALIVLMISTANAQNSTNRQRDCLEQLRRILPGSEPWEKWLNQSGELPPDFDAMPSIPRLPDPLVRNEGAPKAEAIRTPEEWNARREELKQLFQHWIIGSIPPPPDNVTVTVLSEKQEGGCVVREVELRFGEENKAKLWTKLYIPSGAGPFPVFMTQQNHDGWALIALRRGYLCCVYAGADTRDDTDTFLEAYPGYDWSRITRRAWAAGRCIDYLKSVPEADVSRVALTGHSRNGKLSLIASALDERIGLVISSSSGAGGAMPTRLYSEEQMGEGIENITRAFPEWFHPRWRFFAGREDKLPIDMHELVALSAPRPCLLSIAYNDNVESGWAMQQCYESVKRVYHLLDADDKVRILWREGGHETWPTIIERYMDWCDVHFRGRPMTDFPERLLYPTDWASWSKQPVANIDVASYPKIGVDDILRFDDERRITSKEEWTTKKAAIRQHAARLLGASPLAVIPPSSGYGKEPKHIEAMLDRGVIPLDLRKDDVVFGEYLNADVYAPATVTEQSQQKIPAILYLHPVNSSHGYVAGYRRGDQTYYMFAKAGYAVFCFDQVGYGRRLGELEGFYNRYPDWSVLDNMVRDAQAGLDALCALPYVDASRIWVVGYGLGAMVGAHLAAFDDRAAGYVLACLPQPFRVDTPDRGRGGIVRWSKETMLVPRLGWFIENEDRIPYDIPELLGIMAPRPVCVISPTLDREANIDDITRSVATVRGVYRLFDAESALTQVSPEDFHRFGLEMHQHVIDWLKEQK